MNPEIEKLIQAYDFKGLARAFQEGDIQWHAKEWEEFIREIKLAGAKEMYEAVKLDDFIDDPGYNEAATKVDDRAQSYLNKLQRS